MSDQKFPAGIVLVTLCISKDRGAIPGDPEKRRRIMGVRKSISSRIFTLFICAIFFSVGLYMWVQQRKVESYVETVGTVKESQVISKSGSKGQMYRPAILYTYEVDGKTYEGNRYAYFETSHSFRSGAKEVVKKYAAGTACKVYYNQEEPGSSVLVKKDGGAGDWVPLIFVVIAAVAAAKTLLGVFLG